MLRTTIGALLMMSMLSGCFVHRVEQRDRDRHHDRYEKREKRDERRDDRSKPRERDDRDERYEYERS